jgi:DNA-3-methyladenine glycosylase I
MTLAHVRCSWVRLTNPLYIDYHDTEWGVPLRDDRALFELLCLEGAQAGLSWETILNKRAAYRECFWGFDPDILSQKTDEELLERMHTFDIIKNKLKTLAVKKNALAYQKIVRERGSFAQFLWSFVDGVSLVHVWQNYRDAPTSTQISVDLATALKKYGWSFAGPVICYAFMQACGMVSDHEGGCWKAQTIDTKK